eukprot:3498537-Rhodomonas_salina.1
MEGFEQIKEAGGVLCIGRQESIVPSPLWREIESTTSLDLYWLGGLHPICTSTSSAVWCLLQGRGSTRKDSTTHIDQYYLRKNLVLAIVLVVTSFYGWKPL